MHHPTGGSERDERNTADYGIDTVAANLMCRTIRYAQSFTQCGGTCDSPRERGCSFCVAVLFGSEIAKN